MITLGTLIQTDHDVWVKYKDHTYQFIRLTLVKSPDTGEWYRGASYTNGLEFFVRELNDFQVKFQITEAPT